MEQKITLNETQKIFSVMNSSNAHPLMPRKQTLAFIKQFACSYHVENSLPFSLSGMGLN
jgi:hypothetical protein